MRRRNSDRMKKFTRLLISSLLLGCLLVMSVHGDSSRAFLGHDEGDKNKLEVSGITTMTAHQKESFEKNGGATHHMRKLGLGVKKFIISTEEETSIMVESKNGKEGEITPKIISGKENDGLKKHFRSSSKQENDYQKRMLMGRKAYLKISTKKFSSFESSSSSSSPMSDQRSSAQKDESVVDAAKEIASLMYKDYRGRPSHKPPINNHEPTN